MYQNGSTQGHNELMTAMCMYVSAHTPAESNGSTNAKEPQNSMEDCAYSHLQFTFPRPQQSCLSLEHPNLYESIKTTPGPVRTDKRLILKHVYVDIGETEMAVERNFSNQQQPTIQNVANISKELQLLPSQQSQLAQSMQGDYKPPPLLLQGETPQSFFFPEDMEITLEPSTSLALQPDPNGLLSGKVSPKPLLKSEPSSLRDDCLEHIPLPPKNRHHSKEYRPLPPLPITIPLPLQEEVMPQVMPSSSSLMPPSPIVIASRPPPSLPLWPHDDASRAAECRPNIPPSPKTQVPASLQVPPSPKMKFHPSLRTSAVPHALNSPAPTRDYGGKVNMSRVPKLSVPHCCAVQSSSYPYDYVARGDLNVLVKLSVGNCLSASNSPMSQRRNKETAPRESTLKRTQSLPSMLDSGVINDP